MENCRGKPDVLTSSNYQEYFIFSRNFKTLSSHCCWNSCFQEAIYFMFLLLFLVSKDLESSSNDQSTSMCYIETTIYTWVWWLHREMHSPSLVGVLDWYSFSEKPRLCWTQKFIWHNCGSLHFLSTRRSEIV